MELENLITNSIRKFYQKKLYAPALYLFLLALVTYFSPILYLLFPVTVTTANCDLDGMYTDNIKYANFVLDDLYFTGYTKDWILGTEGYYYYTIINGQCVVVLIDPEACAQGQSFMDQISFTGKIVYGSKSKTRLLQNLATDLSWTSDGIMSTFSPYVISQPDATGLSTIALELVYLLTGAYSILSILIHTIFMSIPVLSPPVQQLRSYGKPAELLDDAEEELATLPQLATEDIYITEHFFIELSSYGIAIVPIEEIQWIYKYSEMRTLLWKHFSISYTLYMTAGKHRYIKCPKNTLSNIDGVMDYLSEANHDILVGFSEENRLAVEKQNGYGEFRRNLLNILSKRV